MLAVIARMASAKMMVLSMAAGAALAVEEEGSPLEKVVTMLEDLQTEVLVEGQAEAKTYDKFACFCRDMTEEKTEFIQDNTDWLAELEASIAGQFTKREKHDLKIQEVADVIAEKEKEMKAADNQRAEDNAAFKISEADCFTFKKELDWAVVELMAEDEGIDTSGMNLGGFMSVKSLVSKVWEGKASETGEAFKELKVHFSKMPRTQARFFEDLLQMGKPAGKMGGHMGSVVKEIKELKPGMEDTLKQLRADEVQSKHQYQMVIQGLTDQKKAQDKIMVRTQEEKGKNTQKLAQNQQEATLVQSDLTNDQAYLKSLTASCNTKAKQWDQRSQARASELTALTSALTIIKSRVASKVSEKTVRLVQTGTSRKEMPPHEEEMEEEEVHGLNFLQLSPRKRAAALISKGKHTPGEFQDMVKKEHEDALLRKAEAQSMKVDAEDHSAALEKTLLKLSAQHENLEKKDAQWAKQIQSHADQADEKPEQDPMKQMEANREHEKKKALLKMLNVDSKRFHSNKLAAIAAQISTTGPFDKITKLIQELIERLLQEAADEANHKGWCDKEMTEAKEHRTRKAGMIKELNDALSNNEARRDVLASEVEKLTAEIADLQSALEKTTKQRTDESEENGVTVKEAEEGKAAIEEALDMLDKFYKTAAKNTVLAQMGQVPEMPDAGFDEAYTGGQSGAKGILGMMEVIRDDFARTIKTTETAEKTAAKDFMEFETETKMSLAAKSNTKSAKESELAETIATIGKDDEDMRNEQHLLDKSLQELIELQPACVPKVESYEERVAKREQEIGSLKKALCTLDANGPVQTESADCDGFEG
jgi:molybdopterin-guanine dinucleotide biosynthesis protein